MDPIIKNVCWAAMLILLALANYAGLIADKDANVMFAVIPALWVATGGLGHCLPRKARA